VPSPLTQYIYIPQMIYHLTFNDTHLSTNATLLGSFDLCQHDEIPDVFRPGDLRTEAGENGVLKVYPSKITRTTEYFNQSTLPCTRAVPQAHTRGEQLPHLRTHTSSPRTISHRARACVEASDSTRTGGGTTNEDEAALAGKPGGWSPHGIAH
jgi:hypothetical protein